MGNKVEVLIVDDLPENIQALEALIDNENIEIFSATSADEALELVARRSFGLLLLDVQMPVTSGFELAKIIRSVKKYRNIPIIFVTASQMDHRLIYEGYESGAVDLMFKPLDPNVVRAKVGIFVEMAQQRALLEEKLEEVKRLRVEAEAANIAKSQFLASMSHEIRTPLAAVLGFSELLYSHNNTPEKNDELKAIIKRNGSLLMRIIEDVLNFSKIEAGQLDLEYKHFDIGSFFKDIESNLLLRAEEKGLSLITKYDDNIKGAYQGDPLRLKQVLLNIIGNSIKFTDRGNVWVTVKTQEANRDSGRQKFIVTVEDQGVGIAPERVSRLFKPFMQADSSTQRLFGGSGLGLVIARQIALAMGGDIELVRSHPGVGTTFQITFYLKLSEQSEVSPYVGEDLPLTSEQLQSLKNKKILAVDDAKDNLKLVELFLASTGAKLTMVDNGLKAVGQVEKEDFDLILMDVQMPVMDGYRATKEIRAGGFEKPIVAFTAHAVESEWNKCIEAGCNSVITKPINKKHLLRTLSGLLSN